MRIQEHKPLRDLTTMKIGGTARYFAEVASVEELREAAAFAAEKSVPLLVLGGGSNVLISDGELDALVVKMEIRGVEWDIPYVIAGAGENWDSLVAEAVERGLWGIENLSGIPGTVGAAPVQNIGAYGAELKDVLEWVEVFDNTNVRTEDTKIRTRRISNAECGFGYRDSIFKHEEGRGLIITRVALRFSKNGTPNLEYKDLQQKFKVQGAKSNVKDVTLKEIREAVLEIRGRKFPDLRTTGTAGSFFKNPVISKAEFDELKKKYPDLPGFALSSASYRLPSVKVPLAWILDNICHLKGFQKGNVALFERQPIVVVNLGSASSAEMKSFAEHIMRSVKDATGITVAYEVQEIRTT